MYVIKEAGSYHFIVPFSCKQKELKLLVNKAFEFKLDHCNKDARGPCFPIPSTLRNLFCSVILLIISSFQTRSLSRCLPDM